MTVEVWALLGLGLGFIGANMGYRNPMIPIYWVLCFVGLALWYTGWGGEGALRVWLWILAPFSVVAWMTAWGGGAVDAAEFQAGRCNELPTGVKVVWFVAGAILGPVTYFLLWAKYDRPDNFMGCMQDGADTAHKAILSPAASALSWLRDRRDASRTEPTRATREASTREQCHACSRAIEPFRQSGGMLAGTLGDLGGLPRIEAYHGLVCDSCGMMSCPVCSGRKAGELGLRTFVCTACGHTPLTTVFRG